VPLQRKEEIGGFDTPNGVPSDHDDIQALQLPLMKPKALADKPLYAISRHSMGHSPFRYGQTKTRYILFIAPAQHYRNRIY